MEVSGLAKRFNQPSEYLTQLKGSSYKFLPFRFDRVEGGFCLTNEVGQLVMLDAASFNSFTTKSLNSDTSEYLELKSKHFLVDDESSAAIDLLAVKLRAKYQQIRQFTSLHIFVVTLRCDYSCPYCQVSRQTEDSAQFDMSESVALKGIDFVFNSPAKAIKIEFQGGESLLNFDLIKFIVIESEKRNEVENRDLIFVIATNLTPINDEILKFCDDHNIYISTSLDGPERLHNKNRPRPGKNGYELTIRGINKVREALGPEKVSALMTATQDSLSDVKGIIDEYIKQGFTSIFLRSLSPYGFAVKTKQLSKYDVYGWLEFYKEGLDYILELNRNGVAFKEVYTSLILSKMLTPHDVGYVDLQSPAGVGIGAIVFNYDGYVYASDESRMLAEMQDDKFQLGHIEQNSYEEIMGSDVLLSCLEDTITESVPMCRDCAYQVFCGADPVYHHATQGDWVGHKAYSGFCQKNMGVFKRIIGLLNKDQATKQILRRWAMV